MILELSGEYHTLNMVPGTSVHGERLIYREGREYRHWDPYRSKLAAYMKQGGSLKLGTDDHLLYLGAGDGTTVSHLSDILVHGLILAVEFSPRPFGNLLRLADKRKNILPVLADARDPGSYHGILPEVDFMYQDIAQPDQADIFVKNFDHYKPLKAGLAIKARSIDVSRKPAHVFTEVGKYLNSMGFDILDKRDISRWQKDHAIIMAERSNNSV